MSSIYSSLYCKLVRREYSFFNAIFSYKMDSCDICCIFWNSYLIFSSLLRSCSMNYWSYSIFFSFSIKWVSLVKISPALSLMSSNTFYVICPLRESICIVFLLSSFYIYNLLLACVWTVLTIEDSVWGSVFLLLDCVGVGLVKTGGVRRSSAPGGRAFESVFVSLLKVGSGIAYRLKRGTSYWSLRRFCSWSSSWD